MYKNIRGYERTVVRDQVKNIESDNRDVIIIRIKEINGFDRNNLHKFRAEILLQFEDATGIDLSTIKVNKGPIDKYLGSI